MAALRLPERVVRAWRSARAAWTSEGWIPMSWPINYWQSGRHPLPSAECAAVEAAVAAYAQTVAMLPGYHRRQQSDGGVKNILTSSLAQILRQPNSYQTRSDFMNNVTRCLFFRGNSYALAQREGNRASGKIIALHPLHPDGTTPYVDPDTQDVYYSIAPTDLTPPPYGQPWEWPLDLSRMVPARDVWHLRINTPRHPLIGVTPLLAAMFAVAANNAINQQQATFFANMSRPSGTLNTEAFLKPEQVAELRKRWLEHSAGIELGGVPILTAGLKWTPLSLSSSDAQLIEYYKLSIADIARVMRVPLPLIGVMEQATYNNTEVLMNYWVASGLGFLLEHIELSLDRFFGLPEGEYCELDTDALLRSAFKERIEGLVRGVQGGVFSPNEARRREGLPDVDGGEMPRVQQQLVALDWEPPEPAAPAPALPAPAANDDAPGGDDAPRPDPETRAAIVVLRREMQTLEERIASATTPEELVAARVDAALAPAQRDLVALFASTHELMEQVRTRLAELKDGDRGPPGEPGVGEPGPPGQDATWDQVREYVPGEICEAGEVRCVGGPDGGIFRALEQTYDVPGDPDSRAWLQVVKNGRDGTSIRFRGAWHPGMQMRDGDVVLGPTGSTWIWTEAPATPRTLPGDGWRLLVKRGQRGRPGEGKPGRDGADGVGIESIDLIDRALVIRMTDGRERRLHIGGLLP